MEIARLGEGVDRTGQLSSEALTRTFSVVEKYAEQCRTLGVERLRVVATSATRDAANRDEFVAGVRARLGVAPEVLSGDDEARLSFLGAAGAALGAAEPILVVDIGGGSTELVLGAGGVVLGQYSMDVGCVRMRERHLASDPGAAGEIAAARADVDRQLDAAAQHVDLGAARSIVGVAGTVTTITAEVLGLAEYDPSAIHAAELPIERHLQACEWFLTVPAAERAARGYMHPGRVDIIGAGALVWARVLERVVAETGARGGGGGSGLTTVVTSEHDILDGVALSLA